MIANFMLAAAVTLAVASPMTGSFLKCWADRARIGQSVADGRSYCDNCGKTLSARDLVPVLSWLIAGGKSRCCGIAISPTLLLAEIAALLMAVSVLLVLPMSYWLAGLLMAWGIQAVALLAHAPGPARHLLAALTAALAIALALLGAGFAPAPTEAGLGLAAGLAIWVAALFASRKVADAALLLPAGGALLGVPLAVAAILAGAAIAFVLARGSEDGTRAARMLTALPIGLAASFWVAWILTAL